MIPLAAGLLFGVAGSVHCVSMCGPLVLLGRRSGAAFAVYHASRIAVYVVLGAMAGWTGAAMAGTAWQGGVAIVAGLLLIGQAFGLGGGHVGVQAGRWLGAVAVRVGALSRAMPGQPLARAASLGMVNGLLPCGLLYAALIAAAGLGSVAAAAGFMAAFGAASVPALGALVYSARLALPRTSGLLRRAAPIALAIVGLMLILRGLPAMNVNPGSPREQGREHLRDDRAGHGHGGAPEQ
jgi:hypothetical protein